MALLAGMLEGTTIPLMEGDYKPPRAWLPEWRNDPDVLHIYKALQVASDFVEVANDTWLDEAPPQEGMPLTDQARQIQVQARAADDATHKLVGLLRQIPSTFKTRDPAKRADLAAQARQYALQTWRSAKIIRELQDKPALARPRF